MSDIVERLRTDWLALDTPLLDEAADEIKQQRDVIARCDAEIAALHDQQLRSDGELARLRALLRDVAGSPVILAPVAPGEMPWCLVQVEADTWAALDEFRG